MLYVRPVPLLFCCCGAKSAEKTLMLVQKNNISHTQRKFTGLQGSTSGTPLELLLTFPDFVPGCCSLFVPCYLMSIYRNLYVKMMNN